MLVLGDATNGGIESDSVLNGRCVAHIPDVATGPRGARCHDNNLLHQLQTHSYNLRSSKQLEVFTLQMFITETFISSLKTKLTFQAQEIHKNNPDKYTGEYTVYRENQQLEHCLVQSPQKRALSRSMVVLLS